MQTVTRREPSRASLLATYAATFVELALAGWRRESQGGNRASAAYNRERADAFLGFASILRHEGGDAPDAVRHVRQVAEHGVEIAHRDAARVLVDEIDRQDRVRAYFNVALNTNGGAQ